jgi:hypothetical protein
MGQVLETDILLTKGSPPGTEVSFVGGERLAVAWAVT